MPSSIASPPALVATPSLQSNLQPQFYTLRCVLQNRLGGLDRVLGALTHRGILPMSFQAQVQDDATLIVTAQISLSADPAGEKNAEKLTKFLQKQVYVLSAELVEAYQSNPSEMTVIPLFTPHSI